jgi:hypothetical protein
MKLSFIGLALGGLIGVALALFLEFGGGVIRREEQVRELLPPCIFETIPRVPTKNEALCLRRRLWAEAIAGAAMITTLAVAMLYTFKRG